MLQNGKIKFEEFKEKVSERVLLPIENKIISLQQIFDFFTALDIVEIHAYSEPTFVSTNMMNEC